MRQGIAGHTLEAQGGREGWAKFSSEPSIKGEVVGRLYYYSTTVPITIIITIIIITTIITAVLLQPLVLVHTTTPTIQEDGVHRQ